MNAATIAYDWQLGQYVAQVTIGTQRIASLMGACEPSAEERQRVMERLRKFPAAPRRSNYVPANSADPEAYQQAWE